MSDDDSDGPPPEASGGAYDEVPLQLLVRKQEEEIERLQAALAAAGEGNTEQRYLEALRKAKAVNVKYESERTRCEKLARQLIETEGKLREAERLVLHGGPAQNVALSAAPSTDGGGGSPTQRVKELKDKVEKLQKANAELKRHGAAAKAEVAKMKDVLRREVGEHEVDRALGGEGGDTWRGRAQTIAVLKGKLRELQRDRDRDTVAPDDSASQATGAAPASAAGNNFEEVNRRAISEVSTNRARQVQQAQEENRALQQQIKEAKEKHQAAAARVSSLEAEVATLKTHVARVIRKTENDDELIRAYKTELEAKRAEKKMAAPTPPPPAPVQETSSAESEALLEELRECRRQLTTRSMEQLRMVTGKRFHQTEAKLLREYADVLRLQAADSLARLDAALADLAAERGKSKAVAVDLPGIDDPSVLQHIHRLRGEVSSLRERVSLMKSNHEAEEQVWRSMVSDLRAEADEDTQEGEGGRGGGGAAEADYEDLKQRYQALKAAFNSLMMQQPQAPPTDKPGVKARRPSSTGSYAGATEPSPEPVQRIYVN